MKSYVYDKKRYFVGVILTNLIIMGMLLVYALYNNFKFPSLNIFSLLLLVSAYTIFNTLVSLAYPSKIIETDSSFEFHAFGKKHVFLKAEIKELKIKNLPNFSIYIRLNKPSMFQGRYWIKTTLYTDGMELYDNLMDMEKKLDPQNFKFKGKDLKKCQA